MRTAWLCLPLLVLLAGCTGSDPVQETGSGTGDEAAGSAAVAVQIDAEPFEVSDPWNLNGMGAVIAAFNAPGSDHIFEFQAPRSGEATVTSAWTCATGAACTLRLYLYEGDDLVGEASGTGPLEIKTSLDKGSYRLVTFPMYEGSVALLADGTYTVQIV